MQNLLVAAGLVIIGIVALWGVVYGLLYIFMNSSRGCPRCHAPVSRTKRYDRDRRLNFFIPRIRRFTCRKCRWEGLLIQPRSAKPKQTV